MGTDWKGMFMIVDGCLWVFMEVMWVSQCHKPPMTGNGEHTNIYQLSMDIYGDDWGMVYSCYSHIIIVGTHSKWDVYGCLWISLGMS